jgi:hypothetical protein
VAVADDEPSDPALPKRRKRRKKGRKAGTAGGGRDSGWLGVILYLGVVAVLVLAGLVVAAYVLLSQSEDRSAALILAAGGGLVALVGLGWLYTGAVQEMGVPEMPFGFSSRGMVGLIGVGVILPLRLAFVLFYGLLFAATRPMEAWRAVLLMAVGILGTAAGVCLIFRVWG